MANEINAVAGQLWGIPMGQVYTAGPGIKIDNVHKVVSVDETVLWSGTTSGSMIYSTTDFELSEAIRNFERVKIYFMHSYGPDSPNSKISCVTEALVQTDTFALGIPGCANGSNTNMFYDQNAFSFNSTKPTKLTVLSVGSRTAVKVSGSSVTGETTNQRGIILLKVIGINRISA